MRIRLRQIVMVAADLEAAEAAVVDALGVELCYRDPGVAAFGLRNALFPVGDKLLEIVSPTESGTTAGRFLDRRGGDGGYMVIVETDDLEAAEAAVVDALGVELCYRDPGVAAFGLRNALFPVGDKLLEIVSPTEPGTTAGRFLDRRGGDGGYMVIVETDDLAAARRRIAEAGARIVHEAADDGVLGLHLHPADVGGAIVSIDATDTWGEWPWAGPSWRDHVRTERVTDVLGTVVEANDPAAMAARWSAVLGRPAEGHRVVLDEGTIEFVPAGERGEGVAGFRLAAADGAAPIDAVVCGCRFTSA